MPAISFERLIVEGLIYLEIALYSVSLYAAGKRLSPRTSAALIAICLALAPIAILGGTGAFRIPYVDGRVNVPLPRPLADVFDFLFQIVALPLVLAHGFLPGLHGVAVRGDRIQPFLVFVFWVGNAAVLFPAWLFRFGKRRLNP